MRRLFNLLAISASGTTTSRHRPSLASTVVGIVALLLLSAHVLPQVVTADGGGGSAPVPNCFAPSPGLTQVVFPLGATPPTLPYPQSHQLTTEYSALGIIFSDTDIDIPAPYKKFNPAPGTYNVVQQSTLSNPYRVNFSGTNVREVRLIARDGNTNATIHRLAAFSASGSLVATAEVRDWLIAAEFPFFLSVSSASAPIASIVFTQLTSTGAPTSAGASMTCLDFGATPPTNTPTPTLPPTSTLPPTVTNTPLPTSTRTPTPTAICNPISLPSNADAWFEQSSTSNKGDDSVLKVQSKSGNDAFRSIVRFALPAAPAGCILDAAELRLYAESAKPGRTIQVQRAAAAWGEMTVTWPNQPARVGPTASTASGSTQGWRTWAVTQQVADMYASGGAHGFVVFDQVETEDSEQVYRSRESSSNVPTLVLTFRPGSGNPPPPPATHTAVPVATSTNTPVPAATATNTPPPTNTQAPTNTPPPTNTPAPPATATSTRTPTPGAAACATVSVTTNADAWFEQSSTANKGDDSALKVQSKSGNDAFRSIVRFALPAAPAGCVLDAAELRLYAESAKPGRSIQVQRAATAWGEMTVTWPNQPARVGPTASTASGSTQGWRTWAVTQQVADMYASGGAHGFVVFDQVETEDSEQVYRSRESGSNVPTLVLTFRQS